MKELQKGTPNFFSFPILFRKKQQQYQQQAREKFHGKVLCDNANIEKKEQNFILWKGMAMKKLMCSERMENSSAQGAAPG